MLFRWIGRAIVLGLAGWVWKRLTQGRTTKA